MRIIWNSFTTIPVPGPETRNARDATQEQIFLKIPQMILSEAGVENHWSNHIPRGSYETTKYFEEEVVMEILL